MPIYICVIFFTSNEGGAIQFAYVPTQLFQWCELFIFVYLNAVFLFCMDAYYFSPIKYRKS